jgi:hypothetical protein
MGGIKGRERFSKKDGTPLSKNEGNNDAIIPMLLAKTIAEWGGRSQGK